jgi:hypothetical protein
MHTSVPSLSTDANNRPPPFASTRQPSKLIEAAHHSLDENYGDILLSVRDFRIRLADTEAGRNSASMLLNRMYTWRGYSGKHELRDSPNRITLTAFMKDELIGTVTLSLDSQSGLLADEVFSQEVAGYRTMDRKLCEITKLAFDPRKNSMFALASLFHICFIYLRRIHQCTDVFIEVNPRHRLYYERMLGFQQVGDVKISPRVNAPAYLLWASLGYVEEQIRLFGGKSDNPDISRSLYPYFFSPREEDGIAQRLIVLK